MTADAPLHLAHGGAVADVAPDQRNRPLRIGTRHPLDRLGVTRRQVVVDDDVIAGGRQGLHRMAADVARATGDDDRAHGRPIDE
jgi:hypothetical protein